MPVGEEGLIGAGRNIRDGMLAHPSGSGDSTLDFCITGALVIDPVLGVVKADIGIKDGKIAGVGNAGNPDIQDGVDMVIDTTTGIIPAGGLIATPGAIDCHVHLLAPEMLHDYLALGYTTLIGGGMGLAVRRRHEPAWTLQRMMESFAGLPDQHGVHLDGRRRAPRRSRRRLSGARPGSRSTRTSARIRR